MVRTRTNMSKWMQIVAQTISFHLLVSAEAIAEEGITVENKPFGCGSKSLDFKKQSSESCAVITRSRLEQAGNVVRKKTLIICNIYKILKHKIIRTINKFVEKCSYSERCAKIFPY